MIVRFQTVAFLLAVISSANGLQPSDIPSDTPVSSLLSSAKTHLASGSPEDALLYFNAAIDKDPSNYLSIFQRGAAYLSLGRHSRAADDFNKVLKLKPGFEGALLQRGKLRMRSGNWTGAKEDLQAAGKPGEGDLVQLHEAHVAAVAAEEAEKKQDWETCVAQSNIAIMKAMGSSELRRMRGKCHFERGDIQEGINDLTRLTQLSPNNVDPYLQVSAMLFYSLADTERGLDQIRKCLHSDPDSKICSRLFRGEKRNSKQLKNLDKLLETRKFHKAAELLVGTKGETGLLEDIQQDVKSAQEDGYIHPKAPNNLYHSLLEKTCETYRAMNSKRKARPYCSQCLEFNPSSLQGLLSKAEEQIDAEQYEAAAQTLKTADEHHSGSQEIHTLMQKAQTLLKRSKQKDYYKVLGVDREADEATIKRAYRKLTKKFHPDKAHSQGIPKEEAEKKMASINEAYEVLSDPELRRRFDHGDDPNDPQGGQPHFNPFAGGHGGSPFFFQQGAGNHHFKFTQGGFDFQGGFPF
ncbi:DnaJ homolog subfamily C member protein [Trichophyton mentagrophytes]|uniref:Tetratricopeptide repeat and J domain-containing co-chaperone DNJ1 n=2 Tax=Trichophyton TaxID=5550 RepID=A0A9P4YJK8_9EURO|nr:DnaJ and TPR domain-containing protein [Trichophyton equinum CBS 127.97]EZF30974.1 hypothetical protein H101_05399 [Trichophyton interdigitale H6]KAF3894525.1 DsRNA-activated protein kinase inhibitor [Trichophyton interdigitale]GBF66222.1 DnaJ homolog subfamily C member protein [Trichophyton mentagrophytes]KAF3900034.1 DsRNA-activated protein kinase inhibitor [Trichophyton interdigitale]